MSFPMHSKKMLNSTNKRKSFSSKTFSWKIREKLLLLLNKQEYKIILITHDFFIPVSFPKNTSVTSWY